MLTGSADELVRLAQAEARVKSVIGQQTHALFYYPGPQ
jgi:hypothetical protein